MKFKYLLAASVVSSASAMLAAPAFAQSTGSVDFEEDVIIVTRRAQRRRWRRRNSRHPQGQAGPRRRDHPSPASRPDGQRHRQPGPGRELPEQRSLGFFGRQLSPSAASASDRISQTLDGLPLNDSGNYALYTNQQVDPEVLEEVNVNLGVTDVDSPTASAVGGTINIRTREPSDHFGITSHPDGRRYFPRGDDSGSRCTCAAF